MTSFFDKPTLTLLRRPSLTPVSEAEALEGKKYILVYFSARWCPPCRLFTPQLRAFYDKYHTDKNFEIVFVSLDNSAGEMRAYMESDHGNWLALPFDEAKAVEQKWMEQYNFQRIPTLLVFENTPTGADKMERRLVTRYGRDMLGAYPDGENFPWPKGDAEIQEHYRVLKRNIIIVVSFSVALGLWLFQLYVKYMNRSLKNKK